jgi:hypothetical protein
MRRGPLSEGLGTVNYSVKSKELVLRQDRFAGRTPQLTRDLDGPVSRVERGTALLNCIPCMRLEERRQMQLTAEMLGCVHFIQETPSRANLINQVDCERLRRDFDRAPNRTPDIRGEFVVNHKLHRAEGHGVFDRSYRADAHRTCQYCQ